MIHVLKEIIIGGIMQYISIHGQDTTKPILLMLHGGPGMAQIGLARHFNTELEKQYVVVNWDQRGAGKSYHKNIDTATMNTAQFVNDAIELSEYLCKTYHTPKIYICGHSWGSAIGLKAVAKRPELYTAFIGIGQVVNIIQGQQLAYQYVMQQATITNDAKAIMALKNLGPAPYSTLPKLQTLVKYIEKYNGSVYNGKINALMKKGSSTKEYSLWDWVWRFNKGIKFSLQHLLPHTLAIDIATEIKSVAIPVYFIMGQNDYQTPVALVKPFYENLQAPAKKYFEIKNCAHMLPFEKPIEMLQILLEIRDGKFK
jgi:pimeloyl-ACP methyl ester carboxylesterase